MELFVDNLTVVDCSYLHADHLVEGESWICNVSMRGALDEQSMIMDFSTVKKVIKHAIDRMPDHSLIVPTRAEQLKEFSCHNGIATLIWRTKNGQELVHEAPEQAIWQLPAEAVTPQAVAEHLAACILPLLPDSIEAIEFHLYPEQLTTPYYHYSHGLKKHDGNCQRIAHGHRSKIEIWKNGVLDMANMQAIAKKWEHIYIGSAEDIVAEFEHLGEIYYRFSYQSGQGRFTLALPRSRCDILPCDSTVECIAAYLASTLKAAQPDAVFRVKAYEGVSKGAIVEQ